MTSVLTQKKTRDMLAVVKRYHAKQFRNKGKIPYWNHCLSVAEILANAMAQSQEFNHTPSLSTTILCGALGHDLFEDTVVARTTIAKHFGKPVEELILWLTNEEDDAHRSGYIKKIQSAPEEVVLIKYSDLIENTISCAYSIHDLGISWMKKFYLPIKDETKKALASKKFLTYPKTAAILREYFVFAEERFSNNLNKY